MQKVYLENDYFPQSKETSSTHLSRTRPESEGTPQQSLVPTSSDTQAPFWPSGAPRAPKHLLPGGRRQKKNIKERTENNSHDNIGVNIFFYFFIPIKNFLTTIIRFPKVADLVFLRVKWLLWSDTMRITGVLTVKITILS